MSRHLATATLDGRTVEVVARLPYWADQVHRCQGLLDEPALPLQTLRIVHARLDEATLPGPGHRQREEGIMMTKQPPGGVKSTSAQRLREALATMVRLQGNGASPSALTATTLCELAGISRNALYRYHPDVVQALRAAQQKHRPRLDGDRQAAQRLRQDNAVLREQIAKMAALIDHYFAAWQETCLMLQRRDRELAESRRDAKMRVVSIAPEHRGG